MSEVVNKEYIYDVIQHWMSESLVNGRSLFWKEPLWNSKNLAAVQEQIIDPTQDAKDKPLEDALQHHMQKATEEAAALGCEIFYIYALFPMDMESNFKKQTLTQLSQWGNVRLPQNDEMDQFLKAFQTGCGYASTEYKAMMMREWKSLIQVCSTIVSTEQKRREEIFVAPRLLEMAVLSQQDKNAFMPSILAHLFFPDHFDAIVIPRHQKGIASAFRGILPEQKNLSASHVISSVYQLFRPFFAKERPDFYKSPLSEFWLDTASEHIGFSVSDKLRSRKQIIIYGPTGAGKRKFARKVSESLIRQALIEKFKPEWYFTKIQEIKKIIEDRIVHVPLHRNFGYEYFIRDPNNPNIRSLGTLLKTCLFLQEKNPENVRKIPFVIILDNFHRVDPIEMFGEVLSLLRDRRQSITLRGDDQMTFTIPDNLYFIATMNPSVIPNDRFRPFLHSQFLWFLYAFDPARLVQSLSEVWHKEMTHDNSLPPWNRHAHEFTHFAYRMQALNDLITDQAELGVNCQIGESYLLPVVDFVRDYIAFYGETDHVLYDEDGGALPPIEDLWNHIIEPFLQFYESELPHGTANQFLQKCRASFLQGIKTASEADTPSPALEDSSQEGDEEDSPQQEDEKSETAQESADSSSDDGIERWHDDAEIVAWDVPQAQPKTQSQPPSQTPQATDSPKEQS